MLPRHVRLRGLPSLRPVASNSSKRLLFTIAKDITTVSPLAICRSLAVLSARSRPDLHRSALRSIHTTSVEKQRQHVEPARSTAEPTAYNPPTKGLLGILPSRLVPYAELSRLDKPAGTAYLLMPCLFSTLMASCIAAPNPELSSVLYNSILFTLGATTMRGAGCTINDLWDRNLDKLVSRTRLRPLARGAVSVPGAITWFCTQSLIGLTVLLQFPINAVLLAVPSMLLVCTYPLAKRVTQFPQFVLGMAFSWGAFLGFPALGVSLVDFGLQMPAWTALQDLPSAMSNVGMIVGDPGVIASAGLLYASCISWTLLYDTIYAFQDIKDDRKAGIKSTAQAFSTKGIAADLIDRKPKAVFTGLAVVQTSLLALSGYYLHLSPLFYATSCAGCLGTTLLMVRRVNLKDVGSCAWWFKMGCWITGTAICAGTAFEYAARSPSKVELENMRE